MIQYFFIIVIPHHQYKLLFNQNIEQKKVPVVNWNDSLRVIMFPMQIDNMYTMKNHIKNLLVEVVLNLLN